MLKKVFAAALAVLMVILCFAACGKGGESSNPQESSKQESNYPSGFAFDETSFKGKKLQWWNHWDTVDTKGHIAEFENATGTKIEYSTLSGGGGTEYAAQLSSAITAGTGPDIAVVYDWAVPSWTKKGLLVPLDEVMNLSDEIYKDKISDAMLNFFAYNGKSYVIATNEVSCYYLIYRKDLIEEAGLDDPYELWKNKEWNYTKFNEYLAALTYDSDDDGVIDMFGLTGYTDEGWLGTVENGNYVRWTEDGTPKFALTDPDLIAALTEAHVVGTNGWIRNDVLPLDEFLSGKFAFLFSAQWDWEKAIDTFGIEKIGFVQMPYAEGVNESKVVLNRTNASGYAFTQNIDEPGLAEHYIKYAMFWDRADRNLDAKPENSPTFGGSREFYEFHRQMQKLTFAPNAGSFGVLYNVIASKILWNYTDTVANLVQSAQPAAQALIDEVFYED
ncbi:MAG: extracellular solute-binding protein [Oscillospiraceae bacterium]|nr:extracellular solute-binding protein [Oscillospiraceae bacterium]